VDIRSRGVHLKKLLLANYVGYLPKAVETPKQFGFVIVAAQAAHFQGEVTLGMKRKSRPNTA
jgi:hypothetical protein